MRKSILPLGAAVLLTACLDSTSLPSEIPYGFVSLLATQDSATGPHRVRPAGYFYKVRSLRLSSSRNATDRCNIQPYSAVTPIGNAPPQASPGAGLTAKVGATQATMQPEQQTGGLIAYRTSGYIDFTPGTDSIYINVPGEAAGFPAAQISGKTVAPFTHAEVPDSASDQGIPLSWTPAGDSTTAMVVQLRYASTASTTGQLDEEIYCFLRDDGSFTVPVEWSGGWTASRMGAHAVFFTRFRTTTVPVSDGYLQLFTLYQLPMPAPERP